MVDYKNLNYFQRISYISQNVQVIVSLFGIIGNILVICVFFRRSLRKYSYSFYCQLKALGDTIVLLYTFKNWSSNVLDANLDTVSPFFCLTSVYAAFSLDVWCMCLLALISLDRLLMVMYPNRFEPLKNRPLQIVFISALLIYSLAVNIILPLNTSFVTSQIGNQTTQSACLASPEILAEHSWIFVGNILVLILLVNNAVNIRLIVFIVSSRRKVANHHESGTTNRSTSFRDRKFAITSIGQSLIAVTCKLPLGIVTIASNYLNLDFDTFMSLISISVSIINIEHAAAFYVSMFINTVFYQEFMRAFRLRKEPVSLFSHTITNRNLNVHM